MKLMFVISTNTAGGAERVISILCNYFAENDDEVTLINMDEFSNFYEISDKVNIIKLEKEYSNIKNAKGKLKRQFLIIKAIKEKMKIIKPDIVIPFLFNSELPVIISCQDLKIPCITSVRNSPEKYPKWQRLFRKHYYPKIAGLVLQSEKVLNFKDFKKVQNKVVIMNPLSVAVNYSKPLRKKFKIISVGRLNEQKNHALTISAVCELKKEFPEITLDIFGAGELENELKQQSKNYAENNCVCFHGAVSNAILKNTDAQLFVMSSNYEGFPNALVEAMSSHIPVICTDFDTGVAKQLIGNDEFGYLIEINNKEQLKEKIRYAFNHIEETEKKADLALIQCKNLDYHSIGNQWRDFIQKVIKS